MFVVDVGGSGGSHSETGFKRASYTSHIWTVDSWEKGDQENPLLPCVAGRLQGSLSWYVNHALVDDVRKKLYFLHVSRTFRPEIVCDSVRRYHGTRPGEGGCMGKQTRVFSR